MTNKTMNKKERFCDVDNIVEWRHIITALLALVSMSGQGQVTDTLTVGMELRVQDVIGTNKFMYECETPTEELIVTGTGTWV